MSEQTIVKTPATHGFFCWWEYNSKNLADSVSFYGGLFDWGTEEKDMGPAGKYTEWKVGDQSIGGMMEMTAEWGDMPPHWMSYIVVDDVDTVASKVTELGGTVCHGPMDIPGVGRFCVVSDPTGAPFSIFQFETPGGEIPNGNGSFCWTELMSTDAATAAKFYAALLGWKVEEMDMGPEIGVYRLFMNGETHAGGLLQLKPEWGEIPSNWQPYVQVADVDATAARVEGLGGTIAQAPHDIPGVGRAAVIADQAGASISVFKGAEQAS